MLVGFLSNSLHRGIILSHLCIDLRCLAALAEEQSDKLNPACAVKGRGLHIVCHLNNRYSHIAYRSITAVLHRRQEYGLRRGTDDTFSGWRHRRAAVGYLSGFQTGNHFGCLEILRIKHSDDGISAAQLHNRTSIHITIDHRRAQRHFITVASGSPSGSGLSRGTSA